uniref:Uncharacterized protein n=1 Tax=Phlebotomus papatasi TaxID=29031 RepID=A0A1B0DLV4_PHLPP
MHATVHTRTQQFLQDTQSRSIPAQAAASLPLNIDRNAISEMKAAEEGGAFDYSPNGTNSKQPKEVPVNWCGTMPPSEGNLVDLSEQTAPKSDLPPPKRKSSLDEFDLEIEGITLDDNIDTSDVNIDDDLSE